MEEQGSQVAVDAADLPRWCSGWGVQVPAARCWGGITLASFSSKAISKSLRVQGFSVTAMGTLRHALSLPSHGRWVAGGPTRRR